DFKETEQSATKALDFVENKFSKRAAQLPELPWERLAQRQIKNIGPQGVLYWNLALLNLAVAFLLLYWFLPNVYQRSCFHATWVLAVLTLLMAGNTWYVHHLDT
ncbi:hypothetical protein RZS08_60655, partial [Arthrospira platensis SPKY1]|nr:hypothetical protein [Arthrospira platensis SPKY1]